MVRSAAGRYRAATRSELLEAAAAASYADLTGRDNLDSPRATHRFLAAAACRDHSSIPGARSM